MERRDFLKSSAAAFFASSLPAALRAAAAHGERRLCLGVISDIHVNDDSPRSLEKSAAIFEKALRWYDLQGVDAVLVSGDLTQLGRMTELKKVAEVWWKVFPNGKGSDGRPVEELFLFGNHDDDTWGLKKELTYWQDRVKIWDELFHEPYAGVRTKTVKGYDFILMEWLYETRGYDAFKNAVKEAAKKNRTFFLAQHPHPAGTCHGKYAWGRDDGVTTKFLSDYPNAVMFSGHSHYVLTDERTVWQGWFTSIGAGTLHYSSAPYDDYPPVGAENTDVASNVTNRLPFGPGVIDAIRADKIMGRDEGFRAHDGKQGMLVDVYDDGLVVRRHEFVFDSDLGPDWKVPLPAQGGSSPFAPAKRAAATPFCEFAAGAILSVKDGTAKTRDRISHDVFLVTAPAGATTAGAPLVGYDVGYLRGEKFTHLQYVIASDFNLPVAHKHKAMTFPVRKDRLPPDARLAVRPVDCFVRFGRALTVS